MLFQKKKRINNGKTVGSDNILIEVWKSIVDRSLGGSQNLLMKLRGQSKCQMSGK